MLISSMSSLYSSMLKINIHNSLSYFIIIFITFRLFSNFIGHLKFWSHFGIFVNEVTIFYFIVCIRHRMISVKVPIMIMEHRTAVLPSMALLISFYPRGQRRSNSRSSYSMVKTIINKNYKLWLIYTKLVRLSYNSQLTNELLQDVYEVLMRGHGWLDLESIATNDTCLSSCFFLNLPRLKFHH